VSRLCICGQPLPLIRSDVFETILPAREGRSGTEVSIGEDMGVLLRLCTHRGVSYEDKNESGIHAEALNKTKIRPAILIPDSPRAIAHKAAKNRWASWALKKTLRLQ